MQYGLQSVAFLTLFVIMHAIICIFDFTNFMNFIFL